MSLDTKLKTECEFFLADFESVLLSTINQDGSPDLSYSPYIDHDGVFHILASHLSAHTPNLIRDSRATLLLLRTKTSAFKFMRAGGYSSNARQDDLTKTLPSGKHSFQDSRNASETLSTP